MQDKRTLQYTPVGDIPKIRDRLRAGFRSGKLVPIEYRKNQLLQLAYLFKENNQRFEDAFAADLGRHALESSLLEMSTSLGECVEAYHHVDEWAKPGSVAFNWQYFAMRPSVIKAPKGVVLIIGPFNYPILCSVSIMAGAIAAGCAAVVKMSEQTPAVSSLVAELFPKYMDQDLYQVVNGSIPETTALLDLQWDHIVFTGSSTVAKVVAQAAAKHLTPTTLELGGQCPVIIDPKIDMDFAARRILWGKTINSGQSCTAPNHILVPAEAQDALVAAFEKAYDAFYPEGAAKGTFSRLVSERSLSRLKGMLDKTSGSIVRGGDTDEESRFMAPTIVRDVRPDDSLMESELFGPILPIIPVKDIQEAIDITNAREHPLGLYVFTTDNKLKKLVKENTLSGAYLINETVIQLAVPGLPFGGVGGSGYGQHTGKFTFDTFTHKRSSLDSPRIVDWFFMFRFPPYTSSKYKEANMVIAKIPKPRPGPGIAPVTKSGWLSWVRRRPLLASTMGVLIFALALRRSLGYDPLPPAVSARLRRLTRD